MVACFNHSTNQLLHGYFKKAYSSPRVTLSAVYQELHDSSGVQLFIDVIMLLLYHIKNIISVCRPYLCYSIVKNVLWGCIIQIYPCSWNRFLDIPRYIYKRSCSECFHRLHVNRMGLLEHGTRSHLRTTNGNGIRHDITHHISELEVIQRRDIATGHCW